MNRTQQARDVVWPQDPSSVRVVAQRDGPCVVLRVFGEADESTSAELRRALCAVLRERPEWVLVDVGDLAFCDLAGSDTLHHFADEAAARGVPVQFRAMSPLLALMFASFAPPCCLGQVGPAAAGTPDRTTDSPRGAPGGGGAGGASGAPWQQATASGEE